MCFLFDFSKLCVNVFDIVLISINFLYFIELTILFISENIITSFYARFISKRKSTDKLSFSLEIHLNFNDFFALMFFLKYIFIIKFGAILAELSEFAISLLGL